MHVPGVLYLLNVVVISCLLIFFHMNSDISAFLLNVVSMLGFFSKLGQIEAVLPVLGLGQSLMIWS